MNTSTFEKLARCAISIAMTVAFAFPVAAFADDSALLVSAEASPAALDNAGGAAGALVPQEAANTFPGTATGTANDPYLISTEEDLYNFAISVNGLKPENGSWVPTGVDANDYAGKHVALANDITLTKPATPIGIGAYVNLDAMGATRSSVCFKGTFLGGGHTVSNFYCTAASNPAFGNMATTSHGANSFSALFGAISGATVQDVTVSLDETCSYPSYAAGLVACVDNGVNYITHCAVLGNIRATSGCVAGLVARYQAASLEISSCYHVGTVTSASYPVGGLIGSFGARGAVVQGSYQSGEVKTTATGTTYYPTDKMWGIFFGSGGSYAETLRNCVSDQDGQLYPTSATSIAASGNLTGVSDWASTAVKAALGEEYFDYSQGATTPPPFISSAQAPSRYDVAYERGGDDVSGVLPASAPVEEGGIVSIPSASLTRPGYDFAGWTTPDIANGKDLYVAGDTFTMPGNAVTFIAAWTPKEPVMISTETELRTLAADVTAGNVADGGVYKLANDIQLTRPFAPIGGQIHPFSGVFDGDGHVVRGLEVTAESAMSTSNSGTFLYGGLFGYVKGPSLIENLGVEGSVDTSDASNSGYAGGLVGMASGEDKSGNYAKRYVSIVNCFARVTVAGKNDAGGLVGSISRGSIESCYAVGTVSNKGTGKVGGLVGNFTMGSNVTLCDGEALVRDSYAAADVIATAASSGGSLVGSVYAAAEADSGMADWAGIDNCYALVTEYAAWTDNGTPVFAADARVEKTAAQLKDMASTLGSAFKDDTTAEVLQVNGGFPLLTWENENARGIINLFAYPASATVELVDDVSGEAVEPSNRTVTTNAGKEYAAYTFLTNVARAYTATVAADGYESATEGFAAGSSNVQRTVELVMATYSITFQKSNAAWAQGYEPPSSYSMASPAITLPTADDVEYVGYRFLGWYEAADFSGDAVTSIPAGSSGDKVFHAEFQYIKPTDPDTPSGPDTPDTPETPDTPSDPETPDEPEEPATPATKAEGVVRLEGAYALDTMAAIVTAGNYEPGGTVVISTIDGYWDALTAAGVAGLADAPVLMTDGSGLSSQTARIIRRLAPGTVIVCGGPAAISDGVLSAASAAAGGATAVRLHGDNAVGTAIDIFGSAPEVTGGTWQRTAFVCTNDGYWDALAAAPLSYALDMPIFLTDGASSVSSEALAAMRGNIDQVYIVGGESAISPAVEAQLEGAGVEVLDRLAGETAIETSEAVAEFGLKQGMTCNSMGVATNDGYWDALAGAALCGRLNSVLVLTGGADSHSTASGGFVSRHASDIKGLYIFGGTAAVDSTVESMLKSELG